MWGVVCTSLPAAVPSHRPAPDVNKKKKKRKEQQKSAFLFSNLFILPLLHPKKWRGVFLLPFVYIVVVSSWCGPLDLHVENVFSPSSLPAAADLLPFVINSCPFRRTPCDSSFSFFSRLVLHCIELPISSKVNIQHLSFPSTPHRSFLFQAYFFFFCWSSKLVFLQPLLVQSSTTFCDKPILLFLFLFELSLNDVRAAMTRLAIQMIWSGNFCGISN